MKHPTLAYQGYHRITSMRNDVYMNAPQEEKKGVESAVKKKLRCRRCFHLDRLGGESSPFASLNRLVGKLVLATFSQSANPVTRYYDHNNRYRSNPTVLCHMAGLYRVIGTLLTLFSFARVYPWDPLVMEAYIITTTALRRGSRH